MFANVYHLKGINVSAVPKGTDEPLLMIMCLVPLRQTTNSYKWAALADVPTGPGRACVVVPAYVQKKYLHANVCVRVRDWVLRARACACVCVRVRDWV